MSVTMREMLEAGVHFGHQTRFWNPRMAPFIYGHRNKIHIINLERTLPKFDEAMKFVRQLSGRRGTILMVGTKRQAREVIATEARRATMPYVDQRWLGGMLTNFKTVKASLKKLKEMQATREAGLEAMTKKESLMFERELAKLEKDIGGIQDMNALPDALFVIDVGYHKIAVSEAKKLGIPVVGVVDTNHSPEGIDYVIPGNDDSSKAIALYARGMADAVLAGREQSLNGLVEELAEGDRKRLFRSGCRTAVPNARGLAANRPRYVQRPNAPRRGRPGSKRSDPLRRLLPACGNNGCPGRCRGSAAGHGARTPRSERETSRPSLLPPPKRPNRSRSSRRPSSRSDRAAAGRQAIRAVSRLDAASCPATAGAAACADARRASWPWPTGLSTGGRFLSRCNPRRICDRAPE